MSDETLVNRAVGVLEPRTTAAHLVYGVNLEVQTHEDQIAWIADAIEQQARHAVQEAIRLMRERA